MKRLRQRTKVRAGLAVSVLLMAGLLSLAGPAGATFPECNYDPETDTIMGHLHGGDLLALLRIGNQIHHYNSFSKGTTQCDGATIGNTDRILIHDDSESSNTSFRIDLLGGPFAKDNGAEIPFRVDLGGGTQDQFQVFGTDEQDFITFGQLGANLQQDTDREVRFVAGIDSVFAELLSRGDYVSGAGGRGTGDPSRDPMRVLGGNGPDEMRGSDRDDAYLIGLDGEDFANGRMGMDACDAETEVSCELQPE